MQAGRVPSVVRHCLRRAGQDVRTVRGIITAANYKPILLILLI